MEGYIGLFSHKHQQHIYTMNTHPSQHPKELGNEWICVHSFFTANMIQTERLLGTYYNEIDIPVKENTYQLSKKLAADFTKLNFPTVILGSIYNDWKTRMKEAPFYKENERVIDFFFHQRNASLITSQKERIKLLQLVYFSMEVLFERRSLLMLTPTDINRFFQKETYGNTYKNSLVQIYKQFYLFYEQEELAYHLSTLKSAIQHPRLATEALALPEKVVIDMASYFQQRIEQASDIRQLYRSHLNYALFTFILKTGANKKEVNQLTIHDVKEEQSNVVISVKRGTTNQLLTISKEKKDVQPLLDFITLIKEHRKTWFGYQDDKVFLSANQKELSSAEITRSLKTPTSTYSGQHLRHTYVQNVINSGQYDVKNRTDVQTCIKKIGNPKLVELYAFLKKQRPIKKTST